LDSLLNADYRTSAGLIRVQINVGLVNFPEEAQNLAELLQMADKRMYLHKKT